MRGFCTSFCGWHNNFGLNLEVYKYAWIGNSGVQCPSKCTVQVAPNGDIGVDGMISVIGHEMSESLTDPELNAWYSDSTGDEEADMCEWNYGQTYSSKHPFVYCVIVNYYCLALYSNV